MANDGDIHFPPGQRRDKPTFEPPPWERDQFEELARRKRELEPDPPQGTEDDPITRQGLAEPVEPTGTTPVPRQAGVAEVNEGQAIGATRAKTPEIDPKRMDLLMMGLRSQEPRPQDVYWKISALSGVVSALIGVVVAIWGFVALFALKRGGTAPAFMALVLLVFGIGFMAVGFWVIFRSLRQQGVL